MKWISEGLGTVTGLGVAALIAMSWPDPAFMNVEKMEVVEDSVIVVRSINGDKSVADWRVTIVRDSREHPSCQTIPGQELHQGWSIYTPGQSSEKLFTLDVWVGDPGCYERLSEGGYDMFVTWTPRDHRDPVTARTHFNVVR